MLSALEQKQAQDVEAFLDRALAVSDDGLDTNGVGQTVSIAEIAATMGGRLTLGVEVSSPADLARAVQAGLPSKVIEALEEIGITRAELESVVAPARTLARRRKEQRLTVEESGSVERLARLVVLASRVFGSRERALEWLRKPLGRRLGAEAPIEFVRSDIGSRVVEDILLQAEFGLTA